jgi:hypothetical protein
VTTRAEPGPPKRRVRLDLEIRRAALYAVVVIELKLTPAERLCYLVTNDSGVICPLLDANAFARFCEERGLDISVDRLEAFERLGIFRPFARLRRPRIRTKVEIDVNGRTKSLGVLAEGEAWAGAIEEGYADFSFEPQSASWFLDGGHLWHPATRPFEPWDSNSRDPHHRNVEDAFYSSFQIRDLRWILQPFTPQIHLEDFAAADADALGRVATRIADRAKRIVASAQEHPYDDAEAFILQLLSNRFYPPTQTDRRTFTLSVPMRWPEWDWHEFVRRWDGKSILVRMGISTEDVKDLQRRIAGNAAFADPLESWYDLVAFVNIDERRRLKRDARYAQTLYASEHMLRMFYGELTDTKLHPPGEGDDWTRESYYGTGVIDDPLRHLELVVNNYNLNPRPKLILLVEGNGEEREIPRLFEELLGCKPSSVGIEIRGLGGVGEFTGQKRRDKYGALEKFIDDHHHRQTVVYLILDNEDRVAQVKRNLVNAPSKLFPERRVTKDDYIRVWEQSIEFDNFSDAELAEALSAVSEGRYVFAPEELAACRAAHRVGSGDPLSGLYRTKLDFDLPKRKLLSVLVSRMLANRGHEFDEKHVGKRPLVRLLESVLDLAVMNPWPTTRETWEENQRSGYLGDRK